jgi:DNA-binding PadR family transcriptional regulator
MNNDVPWSMLSEKEIDELRKKKYELTEYGKEKLRKLMTEPIEAKVSEEDYQKILDLMDNQEPYPDAMFEEAERREKERKALDALDKLADENGDALQRLAAIEKEEWERKERSDTVLARYNRFYNDECSGMPHGTPITPEHMQAMALECMIDALMCENMNVEYNVIAIDDIKDLIAGLYQQSNDYLKRVQEFKDSADGVA